MRSGESSWSLKNSCSHQAEGSGRDVRRPRGRRDSEPEAEVEARERVRRQEHLDRLRRRQPVRLRLVSFWLMRCHVGQNTAQVKLHSSVFEATCSH